MEPFYVDVCIWRWHHYVVVWETARFGSCFKLHVLNKFIHNTYKLFLEQKSIYYFVLDVLNIVLGNLSGIPHSSFSVQDLNFFLLLIKTMQANTYSET